MGKLKMDTSKFVSLSVVSHECQNFNSFPSHDKCVARNNPRCKRSQALLIVQNKNAVFGIVKNSLNATNLAKFFAADISPTTRKPTQWCHSKSLIFKTRLSFKPSLPKGFQDATESRRIDRYRGRSPQKIRPKELSLCRQRWVPFGIQQHYLVDENQK